MFVIFRTLRKFTEKSPNTAEIKQQLQKKYKIRRFPVIFRNFRLMFADFENSEFGKFLLFLGNFREHLEKHT